MKKLFDGPSYEERARITAETLRRQDSFNQSIIETLFDRQAEALRKIRSLKQDLVTDNYYAISYIIEDVDRIINILEESYD